MKKQIVLWTVFAFVFSFLCACSAYTPGPSTSRSQAAPMTVPTTVLQETAAPTTEAPKQTEQYSTWAGVPEPETESTEEEITGVIMYVKSGVNVRERPDKNSTVLGTLSGGDQVEKVGQEGSWVQIKYNGGTAYVFNTYLTDRP